MNSDDNNQTHNNFQLLEKLFDENPDLSEEHVLELFNSIQNHKFGDKIEMVSESISEKTDVLVDSAFQSLKPEDPQSSAQYEIDKLFNSGGQSDVYLAHRSDGTYNKTVIIKVLKYKYYSSDERKDFLKEVQILADLQHPNIVRIIDAGFNQNDEPWMALDYIDGSHIDEYVKDQDLSLINIVKLIEEIAESLSYVHQQQIYHLDIKPENILIKTYHELPQPILIDFGISLNTKINDENHAQYATPAFASPEQMGTINANIDYRSDIYSLGRLLESLTPNGYANADVRAIINKCLNTNPDDRYHNMHQLVLDLRNFRNHDPVSARPLKFSQRIHKKFNKRPVLNSIFVFMVAVILSLISYGFIQQKQSIEITKKSQYYWDLSDEINNSSRLLYLKPINNIQNEIDEFKVRFLSMEEKYYLENVQLKSLVSLAIAEVAVNLSFYIKAQKILNFAYEQNPNDPKTILALAKNHLNLYQQELQKANQFSDPKERNFQYQQLKQRYLIPAQLLFENKNISKKLDSRIYQSMLLYFQGQINEALTLLESHDNNEIWPIPRMLLASHILSEEAHKFKNRALNKEANEWYQKAFDIINEASKIARSHPITLEKKCHIETELLITAIKLNTDTDSSKLSACDNLVKVLPSTNSALIATSTAYINLAQTKYQQGQNPQSTIQIAEKLLNNSDATDTNPKTNFLLGQIFQIKGQWKGVSNQDSSHNVKKSLEFHKKAAQLLPNDYLIQTEYAYALYYFGNSISPYNQLADTSYQESSEILLRLINHADVNILLSSNLVRILTDHGYYRYQNSYLADEQLSLASEIATSMQKKWPSNIKVQHAKSNIEWTYADYLVFQNKNPEPHLGLALESFEVIISELPNRWILRYNQIIAMMTGASFYLNNQQDQTTQLEKIEVKLEELQLMVSVDVNLSSLFGFFNTLLAQNQILNKINPTSTIISSRKSHKECLSNQTDYFTCLVQFATLMKVEYNWAHTQKKFNKKKWNVDIAILDKGLIKFPNHHQLLAQRAQLRIFSTQFAKLDSIQSKQQYKLAQAEFNTALSKQPLLRNLYLKELDLLSTMQ